MSNQRMVLGESFPEIFKQPVSLCQQLAESGYDEYQQEVYKSETFDYYTPGEYE